MAGLLLKIILIVLVARALWRLVGGILEGAGYSRSGAAAPSVKLVRDPVCGVFVVPSRALTSGTGATARYFCSEKCRRAWTGGNPR
jgi:YHS domain-containing protein